MKRIGLLSDSHSYIDDKILSHLQECGEVWHAGDIGDLNVTDQIESLKPIRAVYGNIDNHEIRRCFPLDQIFEIEGLKVFMTHIGGYPGRYYSRVKNLILEERPHLYICGHSHILKIMRDKKNDLIHMNPGACGKHGFHKMRTMIRFSIENGKVFDVQVIELGLRGSI